MHSIDTQGSQDGRFVSGDPVNGIAPTRFSAEWLNAVQDEINNVVVAAGLVPDKNDNSQLLTAIVLIAFGAGDHCTVLGGHPFGSTDSGMGGHSFGSTACDPDDGSAVTPTTPQTDSTITQDDSDGIFNPADDSTTPPTQEPDSTITQAQSDTLFNPDNL